jgi:hypothetical protein
VTLARRELVADWAMVAAGVLLLVALFLPWSHQLSAALRHQYGATAALAGIPVSPSAWQVYSAMDVVLAVVAGGMLAAALRGGRPARLVLLGAMIVAIVFVVHAMSVPPTNGTLIYEAGPTSTGYYATNQVHAGMGETVALLALLVGVGGLLLSFTADA